MGFDDEWCDVNLWVFCTFHVCRSHGRYTADAVGVKVGDVVLECGCGFGDIDVAVVAVVVWVYDVHAGHGAVRVGAGHDDLGVDSCEGLSANNAGELLDHSIVSANNIGADAAGERMSPVGVLFSIATSLCVTVFAISTVLWDYGEVEP